MPSHVGQVIMSTTLDTAAKVHNIYGGTWERWGAGKVPVGVDPNDTDFNAPNKSGGSKTVSLSHYHTLSSDGYAKIILKAASKIAYRERKVAKWQDNYTNGTGSGAGSSNTQDYGAELGGQTDEGLTGDQSIMQPYLTLYMWIRTA